MHLYTNSLICLNIPVMPESANANFKTYARTLQRGPDCPNCGTISWRQHILQSLVHSNSVTLHIWGIFSISSGKFTLYTASQPLSQGSGTQTLRKHQHALGQLPLRDRKTCQQQWPCSHSRGQRNDLRAEDRTLLPWALSWWRTQTLPVPWPWLL